MATDVWIVVCKQVPNTNGAQLNQQCPASQRQSIKTTVESLQQQTTTTPIENINLDPVQVGAVFSVSFSAVMLFYLVARGAGTVLSLIRRG
jgi:hypothetical protein